MTSNIKDDIYHNPIRILAEMNRIRDIGIDNDPEATPAENRGYLFTVIENLVNLLNESHEWIGLMAGFIPPEEMDFSSTGTFDTDGPSLDNKQWDKK